MAKTRRDRDEAHSRAKVARPSRRLKRIIVVATGVLFCLSVGLTLAWAVSGGFASPAAPCGILPGEFECHDALLLSWGNGPVDGFRKPLIDIIAATQQDIDVVLLVQDQQQRYFADTALRQADLPRDAVRYVEVPALQTHWVRDFGPFIIKSFDGDYVAVDAQFSGQSPPQYEVPERLAKQFEMRCVQAPLILDGGALLSNGAGLCITTDWLAEKNRQVHGYNRSRLTGLIREHFGASEVVFLEPLAGEPTGHVDIFATFIAPDTIVVGNYSLVEEPFNSKVLDRNAERLSHVKTACGPLKVVRIPMPPRTGGDAPWRSYTNIVFANRSVLVPIYPGVHDETDLTALQIYRELLPYWHVVGIDCTLLSRGHGALHCVTMNLYRIRPHAGP